MSGPALAAPAADGRTDWRTLRDQERHYRREPQPEGGEDEFGLCTPEARATDCPVCAAMDEATVVRRWEVEHECWRQFAIVDSEADTRMVLGEDDCDRVPPAPYTIAPLWMVRAECERLGDWEP